MAAMAAMRDKISGCWSIPAKAVPEELDAFQTEIVVHLRPDGSLAEKPVVRRSKEGKTFQLFAASAIRAIEKCAPYTMLLPYDPEVWSEIVVTFDPSEIPPAPQQ
ncbi:TonB C-terminal domain-containing protein [Mesorhizobium retamae]|uniref:TonB C-terminal domain-containing protein n=1 Tax=Mesorhizobium retamae TaxID=2912854 RepID=A0ABS9QIQ3_9HYPH|nr:TonB C-terminal domain-containing protein [Mesorhizobium sp. IRAMC:0171]MCG7507271.1 TonB C-terminal domain-containing protein [Mesorhizobium sp. IRAMC:0171]